jgi:hypothetical protein
VSWVRKGLPQHENKELASPIEVEDEEQDAQLQKKMNEISIAGVFSSTPLRMKHAQSKTDLSSKIFWLARNTTDQNIELRALSGDFTPAKITQKVAKNIFLWTFLPEPGVYITNILPLVQSGNVQLPGFPSTIKSSIRQLFELGLFYIEIGKEQMVDKAFESLLQMNISLNEDDVKFINALGISFRQMNRPIMPYHVIFWQISLLEAMNLCTSICSLLF